MSQQREPPMVLDLDDLETKRRLMSKIGSMRGIYEVTLKPRTHNRSLSQNRYYWSCFVHPFAEWLSEQWGEPITTDQAHYELRKAVLGFREKVNERTGEIMELIPSSRKLDTKEFSEFLDKAAEFLARFCGIVVLPSDLFQSKQSGEKQ